MGERNNIKTLSPVDDGNQLMKKIILLCCILLVAANSFAADKAQAAKLPNVTSIKPYQSTTDDVEALIGKPTTSMTANNTMRWSYAMTDYSLQIEWDMKVNRVARYQFSAKHLNSGTWNAGKAQYLEPGKATVDEVIKQLGIPQNMAIDLNNQQLRYTFDNDLIELQFKNNVLQRYLVEYKSKK